MRGFQTSTTLPVDCLWELSGPDEIVSQPANLTSCATTHVGGLSWISKGLNSAAGSRRLSEIHSQSPTRMLPPFKREYRHNQVRNLPAIASEKGARADLGIHG